MMLSHHRSLLAPALAPSAPSARSGMFFPIWDVLNGTRYDPIKPPASAARPKEALQDDMVRTVVPEFGRR